ncbi:MAG: hypothetical protein WD716_06905 [Fimbriimonadaceae bacterium]
MGNVLQNDLRNLIKAKPRMALAINLLGPLVASGWVLLAVGLSLHQTLFLTMLFAILVLWAFWACLTLAVFEDHAWYLIIPELLLLVFYVIALVKLLQVVRGKRVIEYKD